MGEFAGIKCPMCSARLEVAPGRVACPACVGRFDVIAAVAVEDGPFRTADEPWQAVAGLPPPAGIEDASGGPLLRNVRIGRPRMDASAAALAWSALLVLGGVTLVFVGGVQGWTVMAGIGISMLIRGVWRFVHSSSVGHAWTGDVITLTRGGLHVTTVSDAGSSVREVPLAALAGFVIADTLEWRRAGLAVRMDRAEAPLFIAESSPR